jgi:hypothetical protein
MKRKLVPEAERGRDGQGDHAPGASVEAASAACGSASHVAISLS